MDKATKLLFARLDDIQKQLKRLDVLEQKINKLDTNGTLDEIRKEMQKVAANSDIVVNTVESHGGIIQIMENALTRLNLRCPLMKAATGEVRAVTERIELAGE